MEPTTIEWGGITLGRGAFRLVRLDGWEDLPDLDSGDVPRPSRHGAWAGTAYAQARTVTAEVLIRTAPDAVLDRVRDLRRACAVADDATLRPLTVTLLGERLTADARVSQRVASPDRNGPLGHVRAVVQWTCPDPVRYSPDPVHQVVPPGGARWLANDGTTPTRPLVTVHGPCTTPAVLLDTGPPRRLEFDLSLTTEERLVIDTRNGTAVLAGGAGDGGDVLFTLTSSSVPLEAWAVPTGGARMELAAASSSAHARAWVSYRHAYL